MADKIDIVVTWVDGSDPNWLEEKSKYIEPYGTDDRQARFRDWDLMRYWFRSIETNAPWVNKIYFVTWGHTPKWLNLNNPKLVVVKHEEFIPKEYLPLFNSTPIEVNLHRIKGLSETFIYFNDDVFLINKSKPTHFFKKGLPVDSCVFTTIPRHDNEYYYIYLYNDYSYYSKWFRAKGIFKHLFKYVNLRYGKGAFTNPLHLACKNCFIKQKHLSQTLLKSTMERAWETDDYPLIQCSKTRFRNVVGNTMETFRGIQLLTGKFKPSRESGEIISTEKADYCARQVLTTKKRLLCLSDNSPDQNFERDKEVLIKAFKRKFPNKSSFEI